MIFVFDNMSEYEDEKYFSHLFSLPEWRREYSLKYKFLSERKKSVLAYILLRKAAEEVFGKSVDVPFLYNDFGKPYVSDKSFFFSISHSKNVVACAVHNREIGMDVQNITPYNEKIARKMSFDDLLCSDETKDEGFTRLWTEKEAISKFEGKGLSLPFSEIKNESYLLFTEKKNDFVLTACYGKKVETLVDKPKVFYLSSDEL